MSKAVTVLCNEVVGISREIRSQVVYNSCFQRVEKRSGSGDIVSVRLEAISVYEEVCSMQVSKYTTLSEKQRGVVPTRQIRLEV